MENLFNIFYIYIFGVLTGIPFGVHLHRRWYLWIARHDPSNQVQNQKFWDGGK